MTSRREAPGLLLEAVQIVLLFLVLLVFLRPLDAMLAVLAWLGAVYAEELVRGYLDRPKSSAATPDPAPGESSGRESR